MKDKVETLVVTRSEDGALATRGAERADVPAEPIEKLVDTTGAGDLFAAGFLFGTARGRSLEQALRLDPHNKAAFRRLTTHWFASGDAGAVLSLIERLTATGVNHARLHAARAAALASLGRIGEARAATGFATFASHQQLAVPAGWATLEAFNAALADELLAHPGMRFERYGTASARRRDTR